jgi:hypothetical protein
MNAMTTAQTPVAGITGSDEVYFNKGDNRYYTGSNRDIGGAKLGVIDALTNLLIEKVPQGSNSHSVAADSKRNLIFVPQVAPQPANIVTGPNQVTVFNFGDTTSVGAGICNTDSLATNNKGCVAVYQHKVPGKDGDDDEDDEVADNHGH